MLSAVFPKWNTVHYYLAHGISRRMDSRAFYIGIKKLIGEALV